MSAFAVEACLNHVGEEKLEFWRSIERKLSWTEKFDIIAGQMRFEFNRDTRPFQTVKQAFDLRNKLAHGRTEHREVRADQLPVPDIIPQWLSRATSKSMTKRTYEDARAIIKVLLEKSGSPHWLAVTSIATYFEGDG